MRSNPPLIGSNRSKSGSPCPTQRSHSRSPSSSTRRGAGLSTAAAGGALSRPGGVGGGGASYRRGTKSGRGGRTTTTETEFTDYAEIVDDEGDYSNPTTAQGFEIER